MIFCRELNPVYSNVLTIFSWEFYIVPASFPAQLYVLLADKRSVQSYLFIDYKIYTAWEQVENSSQWQAEHFFPIIVEKSLSLVQLYPSEHSGLTCQYIFLGKLPHPRLCTEQDCQVCIQNCVFPWANHWLILIFFLFTSLLYIRNPELQIRIDHETHERKQTWLHQQMISSRWPWFYSSLLRKGLVIIFVLS